jgi:hypothetical protein
MANCTPKTLVNAVVSLLQNHTFTLISTPVIKKGAQVAISETGNAALVMLGDYTKPEMVYPGNHSIMEHTVTVWCLVPWADTEANEDIRLDFIEEVYLAVSGNRQPASGILQLEVKAMRPFMDRFFGPNEAQYRGALFTLSAEANRN